MKFLPEPIERSLIRRFAESGKELLITGFSFSSGGCINSAGIIDTSVGKMFIKWNSREKFPGMFEAEYKGLNVLRKADVIRVPEPLMHGEEGSFSYLLTEYIPGSIRAPNYWDILGKNLAALHRTTSGMFGLDHNNYIGSLRQINTQERYWIDFYINHRLEYQLRLAVESGKMDRGYRVKFQSFYKLLPELLPSGDSSNLIHGDLWSGNLMTGPEGEPVIFDPAVYFGHREMDLAMSQLFGGFSSRFVEVYDDVFPLLPGVGERLEIYQLYPLLVHVNLFGGGYVSQVKAIINKYV